MKLVLASSSPRRKKLLSWLIDDFKVIPARINERSLAKLARTPEEMVVKLAVAKVKVVASQINQQSVHKETVIVGADQTVVVDQPPGWKALTKPKDQTEARKTLERLRNKTHKIYTGLCALNLKTRQYVTDLVVSEVTFKNFSEKTMKEYIESGQPLNKAGAYGIQEVGERFVKSFQGSYTNIIGLPTRKTAEILTKFGINLKPGWPQQVKQETGYED